MELNQSSETPSEVTASTTDSIDTSVDTSGSQASSPKSLEDIETIATSPAKTPSEQTPASPIAPVAPTYTPNFKYKAGKAEKEIPEHFRPLINSPEREKEIKEILEKAEGIEFIKQERAKTQDDFKTLRTHAEPLFQAKQQIDFYKERGDVFSAAKVLGFTEEQVMRAAIQRAKREELQPEHKAVYDRESQAAQRAWDLQQELAAERLDKSELQKRQTEFEVQQATSTPDIAPLVQAFNQRLGDEGAFRREIGERGQIFFDRNGYEAPIEYLVKDIVTRYSLTAPVQATPQPQMQTPTQVSPSAQQNHAPKLIPVLPTTGSGNVSPAKKKISSLDDIQAEYESMR